MALRNSFKNWRRDLNDENQDRTAKKEKSASMSEPPSKRMRTSVEEDDVLSVCVCVLSLFHAFCVCMHIHVHMQAMYRL